MAADLGHKCLPGELNKTDFSWICLPLFKPLSSESLPHSWCSVYRLVSKMSDEIRLNYGISLIELFAAPPPYPLFCTLKFGDSNKNDVFYSIFFHFSKREEEGTPLRFRLFFELCFCLSPNAFGGRGDR